ncbi:MAG: pyridoxal 5'-phosphate synthase, partial [Chloroflexota bacterium]|nr:pyridoxal 5'-phosphate synthase [Chloroflexota bacterium]
MATDPEELDPDPLRQLAAWLSAAESAGLPLHDAFALATAGADGEPSVRMVLLRGDPVDGLSFYTNRGSRKGRDLAANPRAAAVFHWPALGRQVRAAGRIEPQPDAESAIYWASRPRGSQLSAWASAQGEPVASRKALEERVAELAARWPEGVEIPLPPFWGGYTLVPE